MAAAFLAFLALAGGVAGCSGEAGSPGPGDDGRGHGDGVQGDERDAASAPDPQPEVLLREVSSGITDRRRRVLETREEWASFWREAHSPRRPAPERPAVDFGERVVLVASMGQRPTGGHSIEIEDVRVEEGRYRVVVRETAPGEGCMVSQALTQPVTAVSVRGGKVGNGVEVVFEEREAVRDC